MEVVGLYFEDSERLINELMKALYVFYIYIVFNRIQIYMLHSHGYFVFVGTTHPA